MADDGLSWLSDYVVLFLKSPTWVTPIAQFVDERCIIFDATCEENKLEYTLCHNEFKQLIDSLFMVHLLEVDITPEQFEHFCQHGLQNSKGLHHLLVEQLLSVDDFLTFKAMMCKRNVDLYAESLQRVAQVEASGAVPAGEALAEAAAALPSSSAQYAADMYDAMVQALDEDDAGEQAGEALAREWRMYEDQLFQTDDLGGHAQAQEEAELEQAIALSLQAEEERLRLLTQGEQAEEELAAALEASSQEAAAQAAPPEQVQAAAPAAEAAPRKVLPKVVKVKKLKAATQLAPLAAPPGNSAGAELARLQVQALQQRERAERVSAVATLAASEQILAAPAAGAAPAAPQPTEDERRQRAEHLRRTRELLVQKRNMERQRAVGEYQAAGGAASAAAASAARKPQAGAGQQLAAQLAGPSSGAGVPAGDAAKDMRQVLAMQLRQTLTSSVPSDVASGALGRLESMKQP